MYKIAISGKANSGKNTAANIIISHLLSAKTASQKTLSPFSSSSFKGKILAFADPIKEILKIMFPHIKVEHLYGSSKHRNTIIEGAKDKKGNPLTIRQALIEIGSVAGRGMQESIWLHVFDSRLAKIKKYDVVVVPDLRFKNEYEHLKEKGFFLIRIMRDNNKKINDISETDQDSISNDGFHFILKNDGSIEELENVIKTQLIPEIQKMQSKYV